MYKRQTGIPLGDLEKDIMECIWQAPVGLCVRDVHETIAKKRPVAYTTVMTVMGRLVQKRLLKRKGKRNVYTYEAKYSKDSFLAKVSRDIIRNFVANFGDSAIAHFTEELEKVSPQKRQKLLLKLLEEAKQK